jgi:uncharacterized membrane protein YfcA
MGGKSIQKAGHPVYFEVAGVEIHPLIPPLVGFVISLFTSMGGISGAFLLLPFQMSALGFTSPSVSATNQLYNIVAIPGGVLRYVREGRMVWPLTWVIVAGTLPGVFAGTLIRVRYLAEPGAFKLFVAAVLLYIGARLVWDLVRADLRRGDIGSGAEFPRVRIEAVSAKSVIYSFDGRRYTIPVIPMLAIGFAVGIVGGIYGVGGGSILAPLCVALLRLPVHTIAGANLMATFVTSIAAVIFYVLLAPYYPNLQVSPDWLLGILFGAGGLAGMYCGARLQKYVSARIIKLILVACLLFLAGRYLLSAF